MLNKKGFVSLYIKDHLKKRKNQVEISNQEFQRILFLNLPHFKCNVDDENIIHSIIDTSIVGVDNIFSNHCFVCIDEATDEKDGTIIGVKDLNCFLLNFSINDIID